MQFSVESKSEYMVHVIEAFLLPIVVGQQLHATDIISMRRTRIRRDIVQGDEEQRD